MVRTVEKPIFVTSDLLERGREVIEMEAGALFKLAEQLDESFVIACDVINNVRRQLVVTGIGKSGHIGRKAAATFSATGLPAVYIHPTEAGHGDLGMMEAGDVLLVLSNSGNTLELKAILNHANRLGVPIVGVASRRNSAVLSAAKVGLLLPALAEACPVNIAPTTSTAMQLAICDALAMAIMHLRGVTKEQLRNLHPLGTIGISLMPISELMHRGSSLPLVASSAAIPDVISVITAGCFGIAGVIDQQDRLVGIITDGDLRRRFGVLTTAFAHEVMTSEPKLIPAHMPAGEALLFLNENMITAAFVVEDLLAELQVPIGIIHIHDLLRHGLS